MSAGTAGPTAAEGVSGDGSEEGWAGPLSAGCSGEVIARMPGRAHAQSTAVAFRACLCVCAPPFMEATDASRLVCVVVVSYQEYSLTHSGPQTSRTPAVTAFVSPNGGTCRAVARAARASEKGTRVSISKKFVVDTPGSCPATTSQR